MSIAQFGSILTRAKTTLKCSAHKEKQERTESLQLKSNTSPYENLPKIRCSFLRSVVRYTSKLVSFTFWIMNESASAFRFVRILQNTHTRTQTSTKSGSSCYQHATDDICRCWNSKARRPLPAWRQILGSSPKHHFILPNGILQKTSVIRQSRLRDLNPYEHRFFFFPVIHLQVKLTRSTWGQTTAIIVMHKQ